MKSQEKINHNEFNELHEHQGSENYEMVEIVINKAKVSDFFGLKTGYPNLIVDTIDKHVYTRVYGIKEGPDEISGTYRTNSLGNDIRKEKVSGRVLKEGTSWETTKYSNLLINEDTTKHKYIDPFSNQEIDDPYEYDFRADKKDPEKWMSMFKELYAKAKYIYSFMSFYYFKIDDKWNLIKISGMSDRLNIDIKQQYPAKEDQNIRMVELKNMAPIFYYGKPEKLDTHLIKRIDYESTYFKEVDKGLNQYNFSAGWWYLEIYMPLGDTLKIKRYSNYEDPELMLYKIPDAYGGRQDVLFIVQNPEEIFTNQVGGMYVIRPKDPEQPQRRYKSIIYNKNENGERIIDQEKSIETDEYKAWNAKQKK